MVQKILQGNSGRFNVVVKNSAGQVLHSGVLKEELRDYLK